MNSEKNTYMKYLSLMPLNKAATSLTGAGEVSCESPILSPDIPSHIFLAFSQSFQANAGISR
jgi:hypothetical protein